MFGPRRRRSQYSVVGHRAWVPAAVIDPPPGMPLYKKALLAPAWLYWRLLYKSRPDITDRLATRDVWDELTGPWRYVRGLTFFVGPPAHIFLNTLPVIVPIALISVGSYFYHSYVKDIPVQVSGSFNYVAFLIASLDAWCMATAMDRWGRSVDACRGVCFGAVDAVREAEFREFSLADELDGALRGYRERLFASIDDHGTGDESFEYDRARLVRLQAAYEAHCAGRGASPADLKGQIARVDLCADALVQIAAVPPPLVYQQISTGLLIIWSLILPLELIGPGHWEQILLWCLVSLCVFGVDSTTTTMMHPAAYIPLRAMLDDCDRRCADARRAVRDMAAAERAGRALERPSLNVEVK